MKTKERNAFDLLPSWGDDKKCPDCGTSETHPTPDCNCRGWSGEERKPHIMLNHHTCPTTPNYE